VLLTYVSDISFARPGPYRTITICGMVVTVTARLVARHAARVAIGDSAARPGRLRDDLRSFLRSSTMVAVCDRDFLEFTCRLTVTCLPRDWPGPGAEPFWRGGPALYIGAFVPGPNPGGDPAAASPLTGRAGRCVIRLATRVGRSSPPLIRAFPPFFDANVASSPRRRRPTHGPSVFRPRLSLRRTGRQISRRPGRGRRPAARLCARPRAGRFVSAPARRDLSASHEPVHSPRPPGISG